MTTTSKTFNRAFLAAGLLGLLALSASAAGPDNAPGKAKPWSITDTRGKAFEAPAADKASLIVFVRAEQAQSKKAMDQLAGILKDAQNVQAIAVVSGDDAAQGASKIAEKWTGPVALDPEYAASGKLAVRVWPTTVLIDKAGAQVAHIAGLPASYGKDLEAYLDFAAGKLDKAGLDKRLAGHEVVADSADQKAGRHVQVAQKLAEKGMTDLAKAELAKAMDFKPADPALQLAIARTLLILGEGKQAETVLSKLGADAALPPGELNTLRGWSSLQAQNYAEAKKHLADAIKLNPQPAEACYFLGLVYEHEQDHAKAAESFRKAFEYSAAGRAIVPAATQGSK